MHALCVGIAVAAARCEPLLVFNDLSFTDGNGEGRVFSAPVHACQDTNPVANCTFDVEGELRPSALVFYMGITRKMVAWLVVL